jgi:hypothetical protein
LSRDCAQNSQLCVAFPITLNHRWTAPIGGDVRARKIIG